MTVRSETKRHPEAHALPLHAAAEGAVRTADRVVGLEHDAGAHGVRAARDECRAALERGERVLLDRERMQLHTDAVGLLQPLRVSFELGADHRLPERDVAHAADAVDEDELRAFLLERLDLLRIGRKIGLRREVAVILRHGQLAERIVERLLHRVLEGRVADEGVALRVRPLVHVEAPHVLAVLVPLLEEVDRPLVHAHRTDREDEDDLLLAVRGLLDLVGDLVAHLDVELADVVARDRRKVLVPELLALGHVARLVRAALVNLLHIPAFGIETLEQGALHSRHEIHLLDVLSC